MDKVFNFIGGILLLLQVEKIDTLQPQLSGQMVRLLQQASVGQTFVARHNSLSMIKVATMNLNGANFGNHSISQLKFPPVANSKNKTYYFFLENVGQSIREKPENNQLQIGYQDKEVFTDGQLYVNHVASKGDIGFWSFYSVYPHEYFVGTLTDAAGKIWQDKAFLFVYIGIIAAVVYAIRRAK